jgi:carboxylesterase
MSALFTAVQVLAGAAAVWLAGDFLYSRLTASRLARWEARVRRDPDGVRVGCREFTAGDGSVALLFIHGFADSPAIFRPMAVALAERGFTCRVMRLPDSSIPRHLAAELRKGDQLRAISDEFKALRAGHDAVWLVGHSLGGTLAIEFALLRPAEVAGLVLLAPLVRVSHWRSPIFSPRTWFRIGRSTLLFTRMLEDFFPMDVRRRDARAFEECDLFMPFPLYSELFRAVDAVRNHAAGVTVPTLFLLSHRDHVTSWRAAEAFFHRCASTRKTLRYLPGSGHVIPLDHGWTQAVEEVDHFVRFR